jgi:hypothetical protein
MCGEGDPAAPAETGHGLGLPLSMSLTRAHLVPPRSKTARVCAVGSFQGQHHNLDLPFLNVIFNCITSPFGAELTTT